jgi:hypothetical protein
VLYDSGVSKAVEVNVAIHEDDNRSDDLETVTFSRRLLNASVEYAVFVLAGAAAVFGWMLFHAYQSSPKPNIFFDVTLVCIWTVAVAQVAQSILRTPQFLNRRYVKHDGIGESRNAGAASHH